MCVPPACLRCKSGEITRCIINHQNFSNRSSSRVPADGAQKTGWTVATYSLRPLLRRSFNAEQMLLTADKQLPVNGSRSCVDAFAD